MHIEGKMFVQEDTSYGLAITVDISGDSSCDEMIMNALRMTGRSYQPTVTWDSEHNCYHIEANWDPDPDYGDDFIAIERRLCTFVPRELISIRLERPNEPVFEEGMLIDIEL